MYLIITLKVILDISSEKTIFAVSGTLSIIICQQVFDGNVCKKYRSKIVLNIISNKLNNNSRYLTPTLPTP